MRPRHLQQAIWRHKWWHGYSTFVNSGISVNHHVVHGKSYKFDTNNRHNKVRNSKKFQNNSEIFDEYMTASNLYVISDNLWLYNFIKRDDVVPNLTNLLLFTDRTCWWTFIIIGEADHDELKVRNLNQAFYWKRHFFDDYGIIT